VGQSDAQEPVPFDELVRMLEHLREPLLLASTSGRILAANLTAAEALGTSVAALHGAALEAHAAEPASLTESLQQARALALRARDGQTIACEAAALAPELRLLCLTGARDAEPRARAFFGALSRFHRITAEDGGACDDVCRALLAEGVSSIGALAGGIFMLDEAGANLELAVAVSYPEPLADRYRLIPLSAQVPLVDTVKTATPIFLGSLDDYTARYSDYAQAHPEIACKGFASLPLLVNGRCPGAVVLGFATPFEFTVERRAFAIALADQCANALERARRIDADRDLHRSAERAVQRVELLQAFTSALAQAITSADVIEAVVDLGMAATSALSGALWLTSAQGASVALARSAGALEPAPADLVLLPAEASARVPMLDAMRGGAAVWIESRSQLEERYPAELAQRSVGVEESRAYLPLFAQGRCIGGLMYGFERIHRFREDERAFLQVVAWYSAQALERARLYAAETAAKEQAEANQRRSDFLADVGMLLGASLDYANILSEVARAAVPRFADWCVFELVDQRLRGTPLVANHVDEAKIGPLLEMRKRLRELGFGEGLAAVMRSGTSKLHAALPIEFVKAQLAFDPELVKLATRVGVASSLVVPLSARGQVLGALLLSRLDSSRPYGERDLAMAEELGRRVGLAVDNARLYQEAREADRQKDEFLAMLSHELRNPLAPILAALELMELGGEPGHARERALISRHVRHVVRLVDDLLDVSRITRGKIQIERKPCELGGIIAAAVEMASPLIMERGQRLSVIAPERGLPVQADQARLTQAVANLLTNAAKYTGPAGTITVSAQEDGSEAVIRVRDSGAGIAQELLPHVFDLFVQGRSALDRAQGGLGIGLTVVKQVVSLHGGSVSAHSAGPGQGSEFVIRLPCAERAARAPARAAAAAAPTAAHSRQERGRVAVVDDNRDAAAMLAAVLARLGCSVQVAHDGASALALLPAFDPQLVLLDIGLPGMDGYELAHRLRETHASPALRIVAVTGYGQPSDRARSLEAGFDDHLVKPVSLARLQRVLDRFQARD
jgi:signal transduction histidine kinase/CheY-like chemotaxis protein